MAGQLILSPCTGDSVRSRVKVFGGALQEKVGSPLARYGPMLPSCPLWHLNDQDDLGDKGRRRCAQGVAAVIAVSGLKLNH